MYKLTGSLPFGPQIGWLYYLYKPIISKCYVWLGGANSMHPLSWGAQTEKIQTSYSHSKTSCTKANTLRFG